MRYPAIGLQSIQYLVALRVLIAVNDAFRIPLTRGIWRASCPLITGR